MAGWLAASLAGNSNWWTLSRGNCKLFLSSHRRRRALLCAIFCNFICLAPSFLRGPRFGWHICRDLSFNWHINGERDWDVAEVEFCPPFFRSILASLRRDMSNFRFALCISGISSGQSSRHLSGAAAQLRRTSRISHRHSHRHRTSSVPRHPQSIHRLHQSDEQVNWNSIEGRRWRWKKTAKPANLQTRDDDKGAY